MHTTAKRRSQGFICVSIKLQKNSVHLLSVCPLKSDLSVDPSAILFFEITGTAECLPAASCEPLRERHKVIEELALASKKSTYCKKPVMDF